MTDRDSVCHFNLVQDIPAASCAPAATPTKNDDESRRRRWRWLTLLLLVLGIGGAVGSTMLSQKSRKVDAMPDQGTTPDHGTPPATRDTGRFSLAPITDEPGKTPPRTTSPSLGSFVAPTDASGHSWAPQTGHYGRIEDGTAGTSANETTNPTSYPDRACRQPTYLSQSGQIHVQAPDGSTTPITIKGVNWFGMDTEKNIPFGLWANEQNGTSLYEVAAFLARHKFNSVRLPLTVDSLVRNPPPDLDLINTYESPTLNVTSYTAAISAIVQALAFQNISVLLDIHYLAPSTKGIHRDAWFSANYPESMTLRAIDVLTTSFCNNAHWNVLGVDLKNEPYGTTWGDNGPKDWRVGAATLGNRMLLTCPQWLAFVEGNAQAHTIPYNGKPLTYYDWWGGGLQNAGKFPLALHLPHKVVWAPHFYSPSVFPQPFLVDGGRPKVPGGDLLTGYTEFSDADLLSIIRATTQDMFGYLRQVQDGAIVFGEFGGLYATDAFPYKTSQRVIDNLMAVMNEPGYAGGYMWALNPESGYNYNPSTTTGYWTEGLLHADWVTANVDYLHALQALDSLPHLQGFPCFASD
ncbi:Aste57867_16372 [Aphanomyces stellatus]|uniref:Aste57867_16372 protein n=1 Tax=Aphanomyces stellatus TaxID=120398 RepID=A0A485L641_9STRA|nr:hypothetical protein As57867_016315 [Aphanomyces stellatus]VFT93148.1 Aste57867_16372 [Aphanomyces stellatus]